MLRLVVVKRLMLMLATKGLGQYRILCPEDTTLQRHGFGLGRPLLFPQKDSLKAALHYFTHRIEVRDFYLG